MNNVLQEQWQRPEPMDGRQFVLAVCSIALRLAVCILLVNLLIGLTGQGLLNLLFYIYAVALLLRFMRRRLTSSRVVLKEKEIIFERHLGDSPTSVVSIRREDVVSVRPHRLDEHLKLIYHNVTVFGKDLGTPLRMQAAFLVSLFSARLAGVIAGKLAGREQGMLLVYREKEKRSCVIFSPDASMQEALAAWLADGYLRDDRMDRPPVANLAGRCLARAFPEAYPHVAPLVSAQDTAWAEEWKKDLRRWREEKRRAKKQEQEKPVQVEAPDREKLKARAKRRREEYEKESGPRQSRKKA